MYQSAFWSLKDLHQNYLQSLILENYFFVPWTYHVFGDLKINSHEWIFDIFPAAKPSWCTGGWWAILPQSRKLPSTSNSDLPSKSNNDFPKQKLSSVVKQTSCEPKKDNSNLPKSLFYIITMSGSHVRCYMSKVLMKRVSINVPYETVPIGMAFCCYNIFLLVFQQPKLCAR